jgi:hypothetical protein
VIAGGSRRLASAAGEGVVAQDFDVSVDDVRPGAVEPPTRCRLAVCTAMILTSWLMTVRVYHGKPARASQLSRPS